MRKCFLGLAILGISSQILVAGPPPAGSSVAPPADLPGAIERQTAAREALAAQAAEAAAAFGKWYESALDAVKKDATGKGDLDSVLLCDQERMRMDRDLTPEEKEKLPRLLRSVRDQYDKARVQRANQNSVNLAASLRAYVTTLDVLEKSLTQKSDLEGAVAARKERLAANEKLGALQPPAAVTAPAAAAIPPTSKAPAPMKMAPEVPVLEVAANVNAFGYVDTKLKNLVSFTTPVGGTVLGRKGRGVLLKNAPETGREGTTWYFNVSRKAPDGGVQIVHPLGNGHLIVHLRAEGLFVVSPQDVTKTPWIGGDPGKIKLTPAAAEVFPMKTKTYEVVSQLSSTGKYTISMDGQIVGTASMTSGPALSLSHDFVGDQGADLPLKWRSGFAALIVGGAEKGGAMGCQAVKFQPSAPEPVQ